MKAAVIFPVRSGGPHRFGWRWRAAESGEQSAETFLYFHDCVEDAKKRGYECSVGDMKLPDSNASAARPRER